MQSYGLILSARSRLGCASFGCRQRGSVSINAVDIDGELARLAAGTTRADEMLEVSWRLMAAAQTRNGARPPHITLAPSMLRATSPMPLQCSKTHGRAPIASMIRLRARAPLA